MNDRSAPRPPGDAILGRKRLPFTSNVELEQYYEAKYGRGGYEGGGCTINGVNISQRYHAARHESAARLLAPSREDVILDAGCGEGGLSERLSPLCTIVHAVDIAGNALDARVRALPNVRFQKMNLEALDFPDSHFAKIACVETLEHLLHPEIALAEFHRTLRADGRLVLTYPTINRTSAQALQRRLGIGRWMPISEHLNEWSYDELIETTRQCGFELVRAEGIAFDFGLIGRLKYMSRVLAEGFTDVALAIRRFPRNSSFVSAVFRKA